MASDWAGFTEEELRKLKNNDGSESRISDGVRKKSQATRGSRSQQRPQRAVPPMKKGQPTDSSISDQPSLPNSARLSQTFSDQPSLPDSARLSPPSKTPEAEITPVPTDNQENDKKSSNEPSLSNSVEKTVETRQANVLTEADGVSRELSNLQQYQEQQKMMEELNKQKKLMLAQALAQRQKKATAETSKLLQVKKELARLDQMLNVDVSVIRDRIEAATRDYAEANKRYQLAENEYINAKMDLHKKNDMKEQLTEHLYTIIHQNEIRKAEKLAELMAKLELECEEQAQVPSLPQIPSLSLLGNMHDKGSGNLAAKHVTAQSPDSETLPNEKPDDVDTSIGPAENRDENQKTSDKDRSASGDQSLS